jgi:hypothetical protein
MNNIIQFFTPKKIKDLFDFGGNAYLFPPIRHRTSATVLGDKSYFCDSKTWQVQETYKPYFVTQKF